MDLSEPYHKLKMNLEIISSPEDMHQIKTQINQLLREKVDGIELCYKKYRVPNNSFPLRIAVIDLECEPPKVCGVLLSNRIYQIYVLDEKHIPQLYQVMVKLLAIVSRFYLFCFSNHEIRFIHKILPHKLKKRDPHILSKLSITNVQKFTGEALISALYSIGEAPHEDPLLRNNNQINIHYQEGRYDLILAHNASCLLSTLKVVKLRYLKLNLI